MTCSINGEDPGMVNAEKRTTDKDTKEKAHN